MNSVDLANQFQQPYYTQQIAYQTWIPLLHWILDQAVINAFKIAVILKIQQKDDYSVHLEFRRALYRRLLDYSKPQLWRDAGPHNWKQRPKRQLCIICSKKHKLKKSFVAQQKEAGIEVITTDIKVIPQVWSGCGFCDVPLCKTSSCFEEWHNQKG